MAGTDVNSIAVGDSSWKSLSNPSFVIVALNPPAQIHNVRFGNAGAGMVEVKGIPASCSTQGANAKEENYLVRLFLPTVR